MTNRDLIQVNEIFGPTVQGEGAAAGRHCLFVRLANCNLECRWCDTPYTWAYTPNKADAHISGIMHEKTKEITYMTPESVVDAIARRWNIHEEPTIVVWSGGEPMMQQKQIEGVLGLLSLKGNENHIETAGTIAPTEWVTRYTTQFNVSPKLEHSGNRRSKRYRPQVLKTFVATGKAWFKFVVEEEAQLEEVDMIRMQCRIPMSRVQIMPEGTGPTGIVSRAQALAPAVLRRGYGLSLRQHVLLWGDKRGV